MAFVSNKIPNSANLNDSSLPIAVKGIKRNLDPTCKMPLF